MRLLIFWLTLLLTPILKAEPYNPVILISIDGFAYHYLTKFKPKNITKFANSGALVEGLKPVFPSKTFPNHVSMVTGVLPAQHGIVHNKFYHRKIKKAYRLGDGKNNPNWLTAMPIWTIAEQQKIKTGVYFWPESETKVDGVLPSYYFPYQHNTPNKQRFDQLIKWLQLPEDKRPHLLVTYFSTIDSAGHYFHQNSHELQKEIVAFDDLFGQFLNKIKSETDSQPNIILVSDHGMMPISADHAIDFQQLLKPFDQLHIINGQTQLYIYEDNKKRLNDVRSHLTSNNKYFEVFTKGDYPEHWQFNNLKTNQGNDVIPNMIVNAIPPATFVSKDSHFGKGTHGYDAKYYDQLNAIFIASGPNIKKNIRLQSTDNIEVFSVLANLLNLTGQQIHNSDNSLYKKIVKIN